MFTLATFEVIQIQFFSALAKIFILAGGMAFQFLFDAKDLKFHDFQSFLKSQTVKSLLLNN